MLYARTGNSTINPAPPPAPSPPVGTATVPTPPPAPKAPSTISFGGYTPDYGSLIKNDPAYLAASDAASASGGAAAAQRRAALRRAYIQYGGNLPAGFSDQYGDIDQATMDAAKANQNSALSQLAQNHEQGLMQFKRALAARGALQSGDLNYGQDQIDRGYGQQQYDAANQFLDQANGVYGQYAGVMGQNASNISGAIQGAESNLLQNPAYKPVAPTTANYDSASSVQYGQPVYKTDDGSMYDQNGNPFVPPPPTYDNTSRFANAGRSFGLEG